MEVSLLQMMQHRGAHPFTLVISCKQIPLEIHTNTIGGAQPR